MASRGIQVVITGEYNDKDVKKAMGDLKALQSGAHETGGAFNIVGENLTGFGSKLRSGFMEPLAGVGAAIAGTFALEKVGEFFKSSIEAAIEDEKALRSLAVTMQNVGDSTPVKAIDEMVGSLALATGVSKDQLIPAFQRLETVLGDAAKANDTLKLAMDVSAGTGKDLESVTAALSKAYSGSTTALGRLGVGIDKAVIQSGDMAAITDALSKKFTGQAAAAADTFAGKMDRISVAVSETKEKIGYSLLTALDELLNTLGGTGGVQQAISDFGSALSGNITILTSFATASRNVVTSLVGMVPGLSSVTSHLGDTSDGIKRLVFLMDLLPGPGGPAANMALLGMQTDKTASSQEQMTQALKTVTATAPQAADAIGRLANFYEAAGMSAEDAAKKAGDLLATSVAVGSVTYIGAAADAAQKAFLAGGGGGTPTAGYTSAYQSDAVRQVLDRYKALQQVHSSGGAALKKTVELVSIDYAKASADISKTLGGLSVTITGGGEKVTQALADEFKARTDTFTSAVKEQLGIIKSAQDAIASYSDSISSSILGQLSFKTAAKDAEGNDVALTPDAIATLMLGDIANQSRAVSKIAGIALKLPDALTKQILALPSDAAIALADYLSANPDMTQRLSDNYNALAEQTKTLLGDPMAQAFATVGGQSAVAMIASAREAIAAASSEFQAWASNALHVTITMDTSSVAPAAAAAASDALSMSLEEIGTRVAAMSTGMPLGAPMDAATAYRIAITGRANGGPVTAGTPYMVGERGVPELFVPDINGTIIPNGGMTGGSGGFGNQYAITVNSGVGDPRQIGQDIVQYIRLFEQSSGRVFAKA